MKTQLPEKKTAGAEMPTEKGINKLLIDQALFLAAGIVIMMLIPLFCGPVFTWIFEITVLLAWGYLCRYIIFLPLDILIGKSCCTAYYSGKSSVESLEFFKKQNYPVWRFYTKHNRRIELLVPTEAANENSGEISRPPGKVMLNISYYPLSKILLSWEIFVEEN